MISITEVEYPRFEINFGGKNKDRKPEIIEVAEFIGIKSYKAKGKRLSKYQVELVKELEPILGLKEAEEVIEEAPEIDDEIIDEPDEEDTNGQMTLDL
jgi:topoisomerase-4 subunit A